MFIMGLFRFITAVTLKHLDSVQDMTIMIVMAVAGRKRPNLNMLITAAAWKAYTQS